MYRLCAALKFPIIEEIEKQRARVAPKCMQQNVCSLFLVSYIHTNTFTNIRIFFRASTDSFRFGGKCGGGAARGLLFERCLVALSKH